MKKLFTALTAIAALTLAPALQAETESEKNPFIPTISLDLQYANRYISDGFVFTPESMGFANLTLEWDPAEFFGFYGSVWCANDFNDCNEGEMKGDHEGGVQYEPEEFDYTGGIWFALPGGEFLGNVVIDLSYCYWDMPKRTGWNVPGYTKMVACADLSLTDTEDGYQLAEGFFWKPGFGIDWAFEHDAWQLSPYVKTTWKITADLTLTNSAELFWGNGRWICGPLPERYAGDIYKNALTTFVLTAKLKYAITENISFGPYGTIAWALDHEIRDAWKYVETQNAKSGCNTLWGLELSFKF